MHAHHAGVWATTRAHSSLWSPSRCSPFGGVQSALLLHNAMLPCIVVFGGVLDATFLLEECLYHHTSTQPQRMPRACTMPKTASKAIERWRFNQERLVIMQSMSFVRRACGPRSFVGERLEGKGGQQFVGRNLMLVPLLTAAAAPVASPPMSPLARFTGNHAQIVKFECSDVAVVTHSGGGRGR